VCLACAGSTKLAAAAFGGSPTTCVVGSSDGTCAAIDAAKPKWLASAGGGSCVACIRPKDEFNIDGFARPSGCQEDQKGQVGRVCSKVTPNTCVPVGTTDATCAAVDAALPVVKSELGRGGGLEFFCVVCVSNDDGTSKGCTSTEYCTGEVKCAAKGVDDTTCAAINAAKPKWSTVSKKCVAAATNDATCPTIDAAKLKFRQAACLACLVSGDCTGNAGSDVCSTKTANTCVVVGSTDATCAAINAATPKFVGSACVAASLVTCGDGTALTANKCEIVSPTDVELAKMCGEGTTYDKEKKKCATDPTSRCTPGLTNTTTDKSAAADESAGSSRFVSHTATLTATVIIVLFYKL